jgi:hypothetical protein
MDNPEHDKVVAELLMHDVELQIHRKIMFRNFVALVHACGAAFMPLDATLDNPDVKKAMITLEKMLDSVDIIKEITNQ